MNNVPPFGCSIFAQTSVPKNELAFATGSCPAQFSRNSLVVNWGWLLSWFAEAYQLIDKTVLAGQLIENIVIKRDTFAGTGAFDLLHEIRVRKPGETN